MQWSTMSCLHNDINTKNAVDNIDFLKAVTRTIGQGYAIKLLMEMEQSFTLLILYIHNKNMNVNSATNNTVT